MIRINRQTDYAIRVILSLASASEIRKERLIPRSCPAVSPGKEAKKDHIKGGDPLYPHPF